MISKRLRKSIVWRTNVADSVRQFIFQTLSLVSFNMRTFYTKSYKCGVGIFFREGFHEFSGRWIVTHLYVVQIKTQAATLFLLLYSHTHQIHSTINYRIQLHIIISIQVHMTIYTKHFQSKYITIFLYYTINYKIQQHIFISLQVHITIYTKHFQSKYITILSIILYYTINYKIQQHIIISIKAPYDHLPQFC